MKTYLVGGAVRDGLLGYPVSERDWVITAGTPAELRALGYQQVGRDFPVFLHPLTREEYALARTERKAGSGYYGFVCTSDTSVTLEEDLLRRDLTINAMAIDEQGQVVDPYGGRKDLADKILRHVSDAFVEDPLRVLRVARFAARYEHLGFKIAPETRVLMRRIVKQGELRALTAERIWAEWYKSLTEKNPEVFITTLRVCGALAVVLPEIDALFGVPNPRRYHAEIDSGVHSLLTLKAAVRLSASPCVRFAALVHDLGKALTPLSEWPSHHGHEQRGVPVIEALCERLRIPLEYRRLASLVCRYHLMIHRATQLTASTAVKMLEQMDLFRRPDSWEPLLLACEADAQGCGKLQDYPQRAYWQEVLSVCTAVTAKGIIAQGYQGKAIGELLHQARILALKTHIDYRKREHAKR